MRILHSWLQEYIPFRFRPEQLAEKLGMLGLETENIDRLGDKYKGFVVGKVLTAVKHPDAEKLSICRVDVGNEALQIVCGAPNVAQGQKVAVGLIGATVPKNQHDPSGTPFVLSKVKLRGVESYGMICSEYELDLGSDAEGIMVLDSDAHVGQTLAAYFDLNDVAYELEVTPNRPDWLSHFGVAREIGVLVGKHAKLPEVRLRESNVLAARYLKVRVEDRKNCRRFSARVIRDVKIAPSPAWLQNRLRNIGLRPRNNVVDVTNYVMLECGQPLHAFDYELLRRGTIVVRQTKDVLPFTTLDGRQRQIPSGTVMVCDGEREVSIAGVMGGVNSEINDATTTVVLESAYWNPSSIRRTAKNLGIATDASQRFERGADPNATVYALNRAAQFIRETAGGDLLNGVIDVYPKKISPRPVPLRVERVNAVLGTSLTQRDIVKMLNALCISRSRQKEKEIVFMVPTFRVDIEREIDLIEEVARVYGYHTIEVKTTAALDLSHPFPRINTADRVRESLIGAGFQEAITNSLQYFTKASLSQGEPVKILNPQNKEMEFLRTSLIPGLLECVVRNTNVGNHDLKLFEIGHVFSRDTSSKPKIVEDYLEEERVCVVLTGMSSRRHWGARQLPFDIFDLKGEIADQLRRLGLDKSKLISYSTGNNLTDQTIAIELNGEDAGYLGRVRSEILQTFGIEADVFVAELGLVFLESRHVPRFEQLAKFPKVIRDVAFVVSGETSAEDMERVIRDASSSLLKSVELFDVYQGEKLPAGTKSLAFSLELLSREKTLTDAEIDAEVRRIVEKVEQTLGASLRSE